jgi:hypothetical protein
MRSNGFARSLLFALVAAAGVVPWMLVVRPILGSYAALALYLVGTMAAYLGGLAPDLQRRIGAALAATLAGLAVAVLARSVAEVALGLGTILAVGRSAFLYRAPAARAVVVEVLLVGGGLLFARFLAGHSAAALVFAIWSFFLVQSLYFLVGGVRVRTGRERGRDPFEEAHRRALALLARE